MEGFSLTLNCPWRKKLMTEYRESINVDLVEIEELESKIAPNDSVSVPITLD